MVTLQSVQGHTGLTHPFYPYMPIGMLGIYRLLFICVSAGFFVRDISDVG